LFLNEGDFEAEQDNAFFIQGDEWGVTIRRRESGEESWLMLQGGDEGMTFENQHLRLRVGPGLDMTSMTLQESFVGEFSVKHVAEMIVILEGVLETLPFLLV
jgi:hypothetical protein